MIEEEEFDVLNELGNFFGYDRKSVAFRGRTSAAFRVARFPLSCGCKEVFGAGLECNRFAFRVMHSAAF